MNVASVVKANELLVKILKADGAAARFTEGRVESDCRHLVVTTSRWDDESADEVVERLTGRTVDSEESSVKIIAEYGNAMGRVSIRFRIAVEETV